MFLKATTASRVLRIKGFSLGTKRDPFSGSVPRRWRAATGQQCISYRGLAVTVSNRGYDGACQDKHCRDYQTFCSRAKPDYQMGRGGNGSARPALVTVHPTATCLEWTSRFPWGKVTAYQAQDAPGWTLAPQGRVTFRPHIPQRRETKDAGASGSRSRAHPSSKQRSHSFRREGRPAGFSPG